MLWVSRWRERHGIKSKHIAVEAGAVNMNLVHLWTTGTLQEVLEKYSPDDIFNVDETSLFWRATPDRTMAFKAEDVRGGKKAKERLTLLVGGSMTGEKLPLFCIGRYNQPRCFKRVERLPITYRANKKAWMTGQLFEEWLRQWDSQLNRRVAVILDNCTAHPKLNDLQHIQLVFLPPNTTAITQPMDQGGDSESEAVLPSSHGNANDSGSRSRCSVFYQCS